MSSCATSCAVGLRGEIKEDRAVGLPWRVRGRLDAEKDTHLRLGVCAYKFEPTMCLPDCLSACPSTPPIALHMQRSMEAALKS